MQLLAVNLVGLLWLVSLFWSAYRVVVVWCLTLDAVLSSYGFLCTLAPTTVLVVLFWTRACSQLSPHAQRLEYEADCQRTTTPGSPALQHPPSSWCVATRLPNSQPVIAAYFE